MKYCNGIRNQIVDLLYKELFIKLKLTTNITKNDIDNWYKTFSGNFLMPKRTAPTIPLGVYPGAKGLLLWNNYYLGHDLPIWIEGNFKYQVNGSWKIKMPQSIDTESPIGEKRIMIVGQDPMRKDPDPRELIVMSPWGLHDPLRFGKHSTFHNLVVCPLLAKDYMIYVTDFYKLYATARKKKSC